MKVFLKILFVFVVIGVVLLNVYNYFKLSVTSKVKQEVKDDIEENYTALEPVVVIDPIEQLVYDNKLAEYKKRVDGCIASLTRPKTGMFGAEAYTTHFATERCTTVFAHLKPKPLI